MSITKVALATAFLLASAASQTSVALAQTLAQPATPPQPLSESVPSDLPRVARPLHYPIAIEPDAAKLTFTGQSTAEIEVFAVTSELVLHAVELKIAKAMLIPAGGGVAIPLKIALDDEKQLARFTAPSRVAPGRYTLTTDYSGTINTQANGLFALDYNDVTTGQPRRGLFTQFEAPDARRFAPLFDEPSYKATFDLSAIIPAVQMAVSNMPIAHEDPLGDGRKRVTFATSPKMSSYLLFFGVGDFERIARKASNGTEVGVVGVAGRLSPLRRWDQRPGRARPQRPAVDHPRADGVPRRGAGAAG